MRKGMTRFGKLVCIAVVLNVLVFSQERKPRLIWRQNSLKDFASGSFGDGGANTYVSAKGTIQLVNRWDLDLNGSLDLVFANTHPHVEKLDSVIFWGNGKDFDQARTSSLPNDGAQHSTAADLNRDGRSDLVLANYTNGTWDGMDSFIYSGGSADASRNSSRWRFPPFERKVTLPTRAAQHSAVADLNKDGYPDIVFALSAGFWEYRAAGPEGYESPSRIYWGSAQGFDKNRKTELPALAAAAVAVADLNNDSWPDIVFANHEKAGAFDVDSYVYWGGSKGFDPRNRTELPTSAASWVVVGDVNGDRLPDIVFANGQGNQSSVYLNGSGGFSPTRRLQLATSNARACALADLNHDGWPDIFFTNHETAGNPLTHSYLYWGSAQGFAEDRRQEFETVGAWGVSIADLNHDGFEEIVVSNYKEHFSFDVPSYVYWNFKGKFSDTRRTSLFTHGAIGNTVADFNNDGHLDVMFMNTIGRSRGGISPIYIYWGDQQGLYTPKRRQELPAVDPYEWAAGDFNDDGWSDLVIANFGETVRWRQESYIYWGSPRGFSVDRRSALMGNGSGGVSIADLDRDGYLDIVLSNSPKASDPEKGAFVYWGSSTGFIVTERSELPIGAISATIADLNGDGHLDLIFGSRAGEGVSILWGDGSRNYGIGRRSIVPDSQGITGVEAADLNRDGALDLILSRAIDRGSRLASSFIAWGNKKGEFGNQPLTKFETEGTIVITVADVNQDGWLDLVCPNYNTGSSRATLSRIYLGGPEGFSPERMITLPTNAGAGSLAADFNHDGYTDVLFICHRSEGDPNQLGAFGDHMTDSFLYWGSPNGFDPSHRLGIPAQGPHNDSGVDLGNIYDRRHEYDYISSAFHFDQQKSATLSWRAQTPHGSSVHFQIRTAPTEQALPAASWSGFAGAASYYESPGRIATPDSSHRWIQYRAVLKSRDGAASPALEEVVMTFD